MSRYIKKVKTLLTIYHIHHPASAFVRLHTRPAPIHNDNHACWSFGPFHTLAILHGQHMTFDLYLSIEIITKTLDNIESGNLLTSTLVMMVEWKKSNSRNIGQWD